MRPTGFFSALLAAVFAGGGVLCVAHAPAMAQVGGQVQSNQLLDSIANRINQDIDALNADDADYGGHRVKAMGHMRRAHREIKAAEDFAMAHGIGGGAVDPGLAANIAKGGVRRPQVGSDENLAAIQRDVQGLVGQIRSGADDYGGHRTAAANLLEGAAYELGLALQYRQTHR